MKKIQFMSHVITRKNNKEEHVKMNSLIIALSILLIYITNQFTHTNKSTCREGTRRLAAFIFPHSNHP